MRWNRIVLGLAVPFAVSLAEAEESPVQLSLFTPVQIVSETKGVSAFRFNLIYGRNTYVRYVDIGLINHTTSDGSAGIQWGLVGVTGGWSGVQFNSVNINQEGQFEGLQWGVVNAAEDFEGFQLGWLNVSKHTHGLQVGIINYTETMNGLQIGLGNIIREGGVLPFLPIVNWSF